MSLRRNLLALASGILFAIGLGISGMTKPSKVLSFLDVTGAWDPSLCCVMGAALGVGLVAFPIVMRRARPLFDDRFHVPGTSTIDLRLVAGSALFGAGWGLGGFCPGPAIVGVASGATATWVFAAAMFVGLVAVGLVLRFRGRDAAAESIRPPRIRAPRTEPTAHRPEGAASAPTAVTNL